MKGRPALALGSLVLLAFAILSGCDSSGALAPDLVPNAGASCPPLTRDADLESIFPTEIDDQPVINVESAYFVETVCLEGGQAGVDAVSSRAPAGVDLSRIVIGSAETELDGTPLRISAFRVPGASEEELRAALIGLAESVGGEQEKFSAEAPVGQVGGKSVRIWMDGEGRTSYLYWIDDILIAADRVTPSQADRIFAAFP